MSMRKTPFRQKWTPPPRMRDREPGSVAVSPGRRASMLPALLVPKPKTVPWRNPHLLDMAKGKPCLFRLPGVCNHNPETTVAAHSNLSIHGKAGSRKADDCFTAAGCFNCHSWYDQGPAPAEEKTAAFMLAHANQVLDWRKTAKDRTADRKDRASAIAALTRLDCWPAVE